MPSRGVSERSPGPFAVLVADASETTRLLYSRWLRTARVRVEVVEDGRQALVKALTDRYDVLIADSPLIGIRGEELCELLRRDPATRHMGLIIVTAEPAGELLDRITKAADTVFAKPCPPDVVLAEARRLVRNAREARIHQKPIPVTIPQARRRGRRPSEERPPMSTERSLLICPECEERLLYETPSAGSPPSAQEPQAVYTCPRNCGQFEYNRQTKTLNRLERSAQLSAVGSRPADS